MSTPVYNRIIRKMVIGFGNLFNDITLVRYNTDNSESERFKIPIAYSSKELYVMRLEEDLNLDKKVQMTLPRLSFELDGLNYDASRKQNTNIRNFAQTSNGVIAQYNPVPYNFDFNLYLYVRNIEDATQVLEHIIPYFTPDYTIKLNLIPEMGMVKEIPLILNSTQKDIRYEGNRETDPRLIIWTLNFTAKGYIFGKTTGVGLIKHSITNILNDITPEDIVEFTIDPLSGAGNYQTNEMVFQGYNYASAIATAKVVSWSNNKLKLTNINGNFISSEPIYSINNTTNYKFTSYTPQSSLMAKIDITPDPLTANATTPYIANTIITEY